MIDAELIRDAALQAARESGIPARTFEKDFYATQALREIAIDMPAAVVFKGGTSLSKAYGLIDRFSEDIDLLIDPLAEQLTDKDVPAILDRITSAALRSMPNAKLFVDPLKDGPLSRETKVEQPFGTPRQSGVGSAIKLEAGMRGGPVPAEPRALVPMLGSAGLDLSGPEFEQFEMLTLHPARTLVEKLMIVADLGDRLANGATASVGTRIGRHFYDIHALLADDSPAIAYLVETGELTVIVRDCEEITARYYPPVVPRTGSLVEVATFSDERIWGLLEGAYVQACNDLCYPGASVPPWSDVRGRIQSKRELLTLN